MRRNQPGLDAGRHGGGLDGARHRTELRRGTLTSGTADQLAALVARAAHAPSGLIHFVDGEQLRLYGTWGLSVRWADVAGTPVKDSLAGIVASTREPLVIADLGTDPRVPPGSPVRTRALGGAYLGHPIRDPDGEVL